MTRLIFVRHAETDLAGTFCGQTDPELNHRGRTQLTGLIDKLRGETFLKVYTSNLSRAQQTAQAIASHHGVALHERAGLREIYFGDWEGLSWCEIESRDPVLAKRWVEEYPNLPAPGGETFQHFATRVQNEIDFLLQEAGQFPIVVVTHAGFLRIALPRLCDITEQKAIELSSTYAAVISTGLLPAHTS